MAVLQLQPVGSEIWTYEGSTVSFYGFPFPTRMSVISDLVLYAQDA
jgi:hypothetical protein